MIEANKCGSIEAIRKQIDIVDRQLMELFAKRFEYVKEIVKYKDKTEAAIVASERKEFVLNERSKWAEELGLDKETFRFIFNYLIDHNISKEMEIIEIQHSETL